MRLLITGGAGFIGSHLLERLLREGHEIAVVDNLNDFYSPSLKRANLAAAEQIAPFAFYERDILDAAAMDRVMAETRPEAIIHLAARAGVRPSLEEPLLYEAVNVQGTMVLLAAACRHQVRRFLLASSSSIYGVANQVPFSEDDHLNYPISPYAATKLAAEKICYTYSHLYGLDVACLRFFTVYGPRQRPDLAIRKFTELIDRGQPIVMYGDGTSGRDYTYVEDTVAGIVAALHHSGRYDIFNLGNSSPVSLNTLIETIGRHLGKRPVIREMPMQPGDVPITYADITRATQVLGYRPAISFDQGIGRFVEWYAQNTREVAAHA